MPSGAVLITGGSRGIGLELAKLFARDGARLVLVARGKEELEKAALVIASPSTPLRINSAKQFRAGDRHGQRPRDDEQSIAIAADLSDPESVPQIIHELKRRQIEIDVLVNNAGFGLLGSFAATDWDKEAAMIQVNVTALTHLTKTLLPGMIARKKGRILNVASTAAFQPGPFMAVYYASKAFVLSFSEALHEELRDTGVTVTTLCPGPVATNFQSRAAMGDVRLFRQNVMDAATVARVAYRALNRSQRLVIPGARSALGAWLVRLAPRALVLRAVRQLHHPTDRT